MLHTNFSPNFEIECNPELPGDGKWKLPERYVPKSFKPGINGHLILKLEIDGIKEIWHVGSNPDSEVWVTPDGKGLLVFGWFKAYYIPVREPGALKEIGLHYPKVTPLRERGILLLNDYFRLTAYDKKGVRWESPYLVDDDLTIERIEGGRLLCSGFSLHNVSEKVFFTVDISTGAILDNNLQPYRPIKRSLRVRLQNMRGMRKIFRKKAK